VVDHISGSAARVSDTRATSVAATSHRHIDVVEVHHFFTATDAISYEGRGFAEQSGGCKIVEAEDLSIGGEMPVNANGGATALGVAHGG
jgi:acetyl-CoA C-acetyltransferase